MPRTRQTLLPLSGDIPELEALPQAIVAYGRDLSPGEVLPFHTHRRAQLIYGRTGVMAVTTEAAAYVVPPNQAVWMPPGVNHRIEAKNAVEMRTVYITPEAADDLPEGVCVLQVSSLLRELLLAAVTAGPQYAADTPTARLGMVLLDQIKIQPIAPLVLPMPTDARLRHVCQALLVNPADPRTLAAWAMGAGASTRTLGRLFQNQTGMSFRAWRQQCKLLRALELLALGNTVTAVSLELGYDSVSAFIAMFKRTYGITPTGYLTTLWEHPTADSRLPF